MAVYRYNGPVNLTRMAHPTNGKPHFDFTFYKGEIYEGKWINKEGDFGDFVLNSGEEIQCLDKTDFKRASKRSKPKIKYPITLEYAGNILTFKNKKDLEEHVLDNISTFADANYSPTITDANGLDLGCNWSVKIELVK